MMPWASCSVSAACIASENASCAARYARSPASTALRWCAAAESSSTIALRLSASPASSSPPLEGRRVDSSPPATWPANAAYSRARTATRRTSRSTPTRLSSPKTSAIASAALRQRRPARSVRRSLPGLREVPGAVGLLRRLQAVEGVAEPVPVGLGVDRAGSAAAHDPLAGRDVGRIGGADAVATTRSSGAVKSPTDSASRDRRDELGVARVDLPVEGADLAGVRRAQAGVGQTEVALGDAHRGVGPDALGELALDGGGALGRVARRADGDPRHRGQREGERDDRDRRLADDARVGEAPPGHVLPR